MRRAGGVGYGGGAFDSVPIKTGQIELENIAYVKYRYN
jgi:hypothetical protein